MNRRHLVIDKEDKTKTLLQIQSGISVCAKNGKITLARKSSRISVHSTYVVSRDTLLHWR